MKDLIRKIIDKSQSSLITYPKLFKSTDFTDYAVFSFFSVLIGVVAGFTAVIFHNAIEFFNSVFFEQTKEGLFFLGSAAVILLPAIGMFIQGLMIKFSPEEAKKKGVYEIVKTVATKERKIKLRTTIFHFFAPVISLGSGVTLGPEGPAAQLGGGLANKISNLFSLDDERVRIFTAAGAGAAIAAIFNTPLAGVFFTLEIILLNDFHTPTFSALIIASVSASAISRIFLGNESVFSFQILEPIKYSQLYFYAILGILSGIVSVLFIKTNDSLSKLFKKFYKTSLQQIITMVVVGLLIGIAGYFYKEIFGIGYRAINEVLANQLSFKVVLIIFLLKFILVSVATNSGAFGGLFAPSLFLGATFGFLFQFVLANYFGVRLDTSTVILISMGAMLGGIHTIPITAIMIIFEMTQDYSFILPLMLAVIASTLVVQISLKGTVHKRHLEAEGFSFQKNDSYSILSEIKIDSVQFKDFIKINENTSISHIISNFLETPENILYVVNDKDQLVGFIQEKEIRLILNDYELVKDVLVAKDISNTKVVSISTESTLDSALRIMMTNNLAEIPVVDKSNSDEKISGVLTLNEIQSILSRENFKKQFTTSLAAELKTLQPLQTIKVSDEYSIKEIPIPKELVGKSLAETKIRNRFNVEVLMIKKDKRDSSGFNNQNIITAEPNYVFDVDDKLVLFGKDDNFKKFEMLA